jgi:hypothetical protein
VEVVVTCLAMIDPLKHRVARGRVPVSVEGDVLHPNRLLIIREDGCFLAITVPLFFAAPSIVLGVGSRYEAVSANGVPATG